MAALQLVKHRILTECHVLLGKDSRYQFFLAISCIDLSMVDRLCAIRAYDVMGAFMALAFSVQRRDIDNLCWSLRAWSVTLLSFWYAVPLIQAMEKFLTPRIFESNFLQAAHHRSSTCALSLSHLVPLIQAMEKFLTPRIFESNFLQAAHHRSSTCALSLSHLSQESVW